MLLPYVLHIGPVPTGDSPYGDAYLVSAEVDLAAFCSLEVSHSHLGHDPSALSEVVPLDPVVEGLQTAYPGTSSAPCPPSLASYSPRQAFSLLLHCSLPNGGCLLEMAAYCLRNLHPVEHLFLPLLLYVHLNPYSPSLPAAVVRRPYDSLDYFPLGLLNWPVLAVAPLPEGPSL